MSKLPLPKCVVTYFPLFSSMIGNGQLFPPFEEVLPEQFVLLEPSCSSCSSQLWKSNQMLPSDMSG